MVFHYQRMGDREEDDLVTYVKDEDTYSLLPHKIKHSYTYFGIPLNIDFYMLNFNKTSIGLRYHIGLDFLLKSTHSTKNEEDLFKPPLGYSFCFTEENQNQIVLNSGLGILSKTEIRNNLFFKTNLLFNYHIMPDFVRESRINQHNYSLGLNIGILKNF